MKVPRLNIEERIAPSRWILFSVPLASVIAGLMIGAVILGGLGKNPIEAYVALAGALWGYGLVETLTRTIPILLCSLTFLLGMRSGVFNAGGEGALFMGAFAAAWIGVAFEPSLALLPLIIVISFLVGGMWLTIAALIKIILGVHEIFTTLMMNYLAVLWVTYCCYYLMRDPSALGYPFSKELPEVAWMPVVPGTQVYCTMIIAIGAAIFVYILLWKTSWGFELRVMGSSYASAKYAGMNISRNILLVFFIGGGIAGLAGMGEITAVQHLLRSDLSPAPGFGFGGVLSAIMGKNHPIGAVFASFLYAAMIVGGKSMMAATGVSDALMLVIESTIIVIVIAGDFLTRYKIITKWR